MADDAIRLDAHKPQFHRAAPPQLPVRVATTGNITISTGLNNGDSIDGVTLATGDRVLVKDQSTGAQNGIYVVRASPGRAFDFLEGAAAYGALIYVVTGTANGGTMWACTNTTVPTIGSTALTFEQFSGGGSGGFETPFDHGSMGATETFDLADGNWHRGTLTANCAITVTGFTVDEGVVALWEIVQDGTGGWDITWDADVDFGSGDDQPDQTASSYTAFLLWSSEGDGTIYGAKVGGSGGAALTIEDEGTPLATAATTLDFVGAGVTASGATGDKTITIPGGATASDTGIWRPLLDGAGAIITDGTGQAVMAFGTA